MSEWEFRVVLNWLIVSDPWPLTEAEHNIIMGFVEVESQRRGFSGWIEAYHELPEVTE